MTLIFLSACVSAVGLGEDPFEDRLGVDLLWYGRVPYNSPRYSQVQHTLMNEAGAKWLRVDVYWDMIESEKGAFRWKHLDSILSGSDDCNYIFTIYSCARWATGALTPLPSRLPEEMSDYTNFLGTIVARYKDKVRFWQIENEIEISSQFWNGTVEDYATLLKAAYETIKSIDPNLYVITQGLTGGMNVETHKGSCEASFDGMLLHAKGYFDMVDVHLYEEYETYAERLEWVKKTLDSHGVDVPIIVSELGGPDMRTLAPADVQRKIKQELAAMKQKIQDRKAEIQGTFDRTDEAQVEKIKEEYRKFLEGFKKYRIEQLKKTPSLQAFFEPSKRIDFEKLQAAELIKRYTLIFAHGAKIGLWINMRSPKKREDWNEFGFMRLVDDADGKDRMLGFRAYRNLAAKIGRFDSVEKVPLRKSVDAFKFKTGSGPVFVLWSDAGATIEIPAPFEKVKVTNAFGDESTVESVDGKFSFELDKIPIFVEKV